MELVGVLTIGGALFSVLAGVSLCCIVGVGVGVVDISRPPFPSLYPIGPFMGHPHTRCIAPSITCLPEFVVNIFRWSLLAPWC